MKQRAAFLRTYLCSSGIALLDEPFSALDSITKSNLHKWYLDVMKKINLSSFIVTHDIDEAILLSDRIYIISGSPATISAEIKVSLARPRSNDVLVSDEFLTIKKEIVEKLAVTL